MHKLQSDAKTDQSIIFERLAKVVVTRNKKNKTIWFAYKNINTI